MANLKCSKCATALKIPATFTGMAARCPTCRSVLAVPQREDEEEVIEAVEIEQEPEEEESPPPRRKPRLSNDVPEPESRKRRQPVREEEEEEEDRPRRRQQEDDDDDRPRRRKRGRRKEQAPVAHSIVLYLGIGVAMFACLVVLGTLGFKFKNVSYATLIIGGVLAAIGTSWIRHVAKQESQLAYFMCMWVPFYDIYFTFTRIGLTWIPCLLMWGGRFFLLCGVALLITHHFRDLKNDVGSGGPFRGGGATVSVADMDQHAVDLLRQPNTAEAKAWLGLPNRRRQFSSWGRPAEVQFVNDLYTRGAVKVTAAEIDFEDGVEEASLLVVTMPTEPEKRKSVLELLSQRLRNDGPFPDRGQKYEVLNP